MTARLKTATSDQRLLRFHDGERVTIERMVAHTTMGDEFTVFTVRTPAGRLFEVFADQLTSWKKG